MATRKRSTRCARIRAATRRGFALPLVIMLMLISSMTIVVIMQRQTAQTKLVETMIADYQTHHAAFGVRSIVRKWLVNKRGAELAEYAAEKDVSFRFILPNEIYVSIWITDGQGKPVTRPTDLGQANVSYYNQVVGRIEDKNPGMLRTKGPSLISIASAPRQVLQALVEDEEQGVRLADRIIQARERKPLDRTEMMNQLRRSGLEDEEIARIVAISTFDPSLWRVNVTSDDRGNDLERYFVMQTELIATVLSVTSWEELIGVDPNDPFAEKPTKTNRQNDESADLNEGDPDNDSENDTEDSDNPNDQ